MNEFEIDAFRTQLEKLRAELEAPDAASEGTTDTVVLDQTSVGRLSRMDAMQGQQMALESERRRQVQLLQVKVALTRIETGSFGHCLVCEEEIAMGRLQINPAATRCVDCSE